MDEEISLEMDLTEETAEKIREALGINELEEIHNRFMNGTETEDDLINHYYNFKINFTNNRELEVVEKKYYEKMIGLYRTLKEIEEKHRKENGLLRVELEKNEEKTELTMKLINANYIHKDKIKELLGADTDSEEALLSLLETIVDENNRLEDIEDKKVQIEYNNVFDKGVESVRNKIKEKIEELNKKEQKELKGTKGQDRYFIKQLYQAQKNVVQELLEEVE